MPPNHLFFICCCLISLSLGQEALFPSTNKTTIHIGFRVIDPKPKTLFHLKGSEILTCFDPFSSRFKSANYLTGETLNAREILFRPSHVSYYKNDLFAIIDQNTFALKVYNLRYSTLFDTNVILNFGESFSVLVNSFIDKDILIAYGKTFISIVNLKTNYIVTTMKSSDLDIKALNYYPEKRKIITVNGDSLVTWNLICDCEKGSITKNATLSENNGNYSAFIERIPDSQNYLSYDQKEKRIMIWNLANLTLAQNISIANVCQNNLDQIKVIDEVLLLIICDKTNIIIFDISTQKILYNTINSSKIIEATVIKDNNFKSVAFLNELGNINILYLNKYVWSTTLFYEKYPQIGDIIDITYLSFYNLNSFQNNETAGYMAIRSNTPDNKTLHIINSYTEKYIGNLTFAEEIKKIIKIGYTDIFLVWFGNEIHSYNQTTIELIWNYKDINFNIDIVDFALYGDPEKDLLPKNNIIIIYSRDNASIKILNSDDGLLISNYILPEKIKDIKFFCMLNTFDSVLYFTQIGNFVNITFDSMTNTTSSQELNDHMDNVLRCKNNLLNYGDKKIEYFNDKFLKVVDPQITDYYYNSSISSITALSSGNFLYYQTNNSFAKIMTNNFQKALLNINEAYINNHFKESILLYNKRFHLTGYYFNEKESFETLFESHCDKLLQSTLMGICLKNDCDCLIDDYSTELISECSEDSYIIDNYLGSQSKGCRKCRMNIENCLACSSETNCKQCDKNYFQVPSKDDKNSSSFCLSFETISNLQNLKNFTGKLEWCSNLFRNCEDCDSDKCTICQSDYFMDLSGECVLCSGQSNYIFIQPDGQKICRICSDAIKNCQECQNSTYCTKCETNEYLNESNHQCMDCSQPSMYKFGSNDGSGQCKLCSAHLNNCINCNESDHCYLCEQDYILDSNGKCTNCTTPNVFKNNANECKSCSSVFPNCDICNITINSCLKCQENFFFDEENQCTSCLSPENYKENPKDGSGKCKSCSTMENCQYCEDSKKCQKCYVNNYLDSTRHCGKCNQDEMFILGKNNGYGLCLPCSSSLSNCINCFGNSTSCGFCQSGYYIHKDNGACILCDAEYFPKYYKDGDSDGSGNCERCSTIAKNCEICEGDPTSCKKCENGYYIEEDGQCSDCSQENKIKAGGNEGYGTCKFCSTCILCSAINNCKSCINVSETKILCEECMKGHYLTENGSCEKCSKECFNCRNKENICMECNPGYFSDDNNKSHCVKCDKNNTLLSKNICYTLSLPSASLNNSYIQNGDLKLSEYDNSLHISLDNLCWKEGNNETNIYFILASKDASFKKYDLDWIKMNLKENKLSKYDHEDNEWKLFGNSHQNNLKLFLRYDFFYTLKYYCSNNFTQSKANQYNLVEIITKKNENGIFSKIFMNFENILNDELNEKLISKIICILENLAHISGNKLIKSIFRRKNITCEENSPHSRYLLSIPDENPTFNIQTIVFDIGKDFLQSKDNTSFLINSTLKNENFLQNFNVLLQKEFMHSNSILLHRAQSPQLTTFEYVPESGKEFAVIPTVSFSIKDNFNVSAIIDVKVLSQKGLLIMGLVENYPANIPTFLNLKNEENNYYNQFNYLWRQTVMVQENHNFIVKLSSLLPKHNYTLYYATENFLLTTHSDIFYLKFEQKSENSGDEDSYLKNYKFLILAAACGVILVILISVVLFYLIKTFKAKSVGNKYNAFYSGNEGIEIQDVASKNNFSDREV